MLSIPLLTPTLAIGFWVYVLAIAFVFVCVLMMLIILVQKPKGGGLSGAFGGGAGSGSQQAFLGARAGDALTIATIVMFVMFIGLAMGLTWLINPEEKAAAEANVSPPAQQTGAGDPATPAPAPGAFDEPQGDPGTELPMSETGDDATPPATAPAATSPAGEIPATRG